ncbi:hypothetical protein [Pontibacter sp. G13]|uniref:hypothetical protein n=1 Tax=Pontibacter sp. G13 TaxID=3074898 RepID=UPI0028896F85|nr:hypothetical protein [Pontibacter sp. G13]WNJ19708.1 hypothetical protein RJD25_04430 [Pontibacter sp. G13]
MSTYFTHATRLNILNLTGPWAAAWVITSLGFYGAGNEFWGRCALGIAAMAALVKYGIQIDPEGNRYRFLLTFGGIPFGIWKPLDRYTNLVVQTFTKISNSSSSDGSHSENAGSEGDTVTPRYDLLFVSSCQRDLLEILSTPDRDLVYRWAHEIADLSGREIKEYNPKPERPRFGRR